MIFPLRILVFSFLIFLGFHFSIRSRNLRKDISLIYGCVLVWYTFLCRIRLSVDVSASDYGHTDVTMSTGEKIWKLLQAIFGMQANGNLAGNYTQAFVLNVLLMIPLGYLVCLWLLDGDIASSEARDAMATGTGSSSVKADGPCLKEKRSVEKNRVKKGITTILICVATSITIELLQGITGLGMTDINDVIANTLGGCVGVGMVWVHISYRLRRGRK